MLIEEGTRKEFKRCALKELSGPSHDGKAPLWLVHRMNLLQSAPPPSLEKVKAQFDASNHPRWKRWYEPWLSGDIIR